MSFPHTYAVHADARPEGDVTLGAQALPDLATAPPSEFGGPGDRWSPETLLVAAAVDCFVLSFRVSAEMSKVPWRSIRCEGEGTLDRVDRKLRFTALALKATLTVPPEVDAARATRLLEMAERNCLVTNSLAFEPTLVSEVRTEGGA